MARTRTPTALHWGAYDVVSEDGRVVALQPSGRDAAPSPIGGGMPPALDDAARLTEPLIRRGWLEHGPRADAGGRGAEPFVAVPWERALDLAADELRRVRDTHGPQAVYGGSYGWGSAGRFHHAQSQIHRFLACIGGYTASVNSYSVAAMEVILPHVIGGGPWSIWERCPMWPEIAEHSELVVSFGGMARKNAQANSGGVGRHESADWQRRCHEAGVRFVNVSPVRGDADAELDARWLALRPGTDVALLLALAHVAVDAGLHDTDFLERCATGSERFLDYVLGEADGVPKDPAWAAAITGLDAADIVALGREIATLRTVVNVSWSIQRQDHGEQPYWAAVALSALSGSLGRAGGGFATGLGISQIGVRPDRHAIAAFPAVANPVDVTIPVARIADALLHPGEQYDYDGERRAYPDLRLVYWAGGNPFHHHQDLNRLVRAWQRPETVIVHDSWFNPLARFADIVFPVATALEREDFAIGMMDPTLLAMHRAVAPPGEVRSDHEVFAALAARLGVGDAFTEGRDAVAWVRELYERTAAMLAREDVALPDFDAFWAAGSVELPAPDRERRGSFAALREDPAAWPLDTPSGRIELFSETIAAYGYDDCPGHPAWLEPREWLGAPERDRFPLHLVSNQPRTRLHSQYDNGAVSRADKVRDREPVVVHPDDARERGIADGDVVRLFNDRGACLAGARLDDGVRRGVVVLATGAWYDPEQPGVPGSLDRHGNPNVLTADRGTSRLAQGPSPGSTLVQVERVDGEPPPVQAFSGPELVVSAGDSRVLSPADQHRALTR